MTSRVVSNVLEVEISDNQYLPDKPFVVVASIDLTKERITLSKPTNIITRGQPTDYRFTNSKPEVIEAFARCALMAAQILKDTLGK